MYRRMTADRPRSAHATMPALPLRRTACQAHPPWSHRNYCDTSSTITGTARSRSLDLITGTQAALTRLPPTQRRRRLSPSAPSCATPLDPHLTPQHPCHLNVVHVNAPPPPGLGSDSVAAAFASLVKRASRSYLTITKSNTNYTHGIDAVKNAIALY